jgi:hypothetical protein
LIAGLANCPQAEVISGETANVRDGTVFSRYKASVNASWARTLFSMRVNQPGSLVRLQTAQQVGGIREDLRLTMDLDLWLRIAWHHGPAAFTSIDKEVATYRYHTESKTCSGDDVFATEEFALLYDLSLDAAIPQTDLILGGLRKRIGTKRKAAPSGTCPVTPVDAEQAWIDRLLISDSLLYRALSQNAPGKTDAQLEFRELLHRLRPRLQASKIGSQPAELVARALLHAMQIAGKFDGATARQIMRLSPTLAHARALGHGQCSIAKNLKRFFNSHRCSHAARGNDWCAFFSRVFFFADHIENRVGVPGIYTC